MEEWTFVIVGGGIAGVSCAEILGHLVPNEKVLLFTASPVVKSVTNVVPLTKMLAKFDVVEENPETFAESQPSLKIVHDPVVSINSCDHTVTAESGLTVKYKKLCICSGGVPKLISSDEENVIGIRDTESVQNFHQRIKSARRVIVVGNGGIATEIVYELTGMEIVWVIKDNHFSAPFIDPGAAEFFHEKLTKGKGVKCEEKQFSKRKKYTISGEGETTTARTQIGPGVGAALGPDWHVGINLQAGSIDSLGNDNYKVTVEFKSEIEDIIKSDKITRNTNLELDAEGSCDWPVYVKLKNGKIYGCDFIVSATGVTPNSLFKLEDGKTFDLAEDGGIKVDEYMRTNLFDVFAAGDVCTAAWYHAKHWLQMRLWTQAHQMGCYVAKVMAAEFKNESIYQDFSFELFTHVTNFFGFKVVLLGLFNGQKLDRNYSCQLRVTPGLEYIKLVMKDGKMQGAILIGDTDIEEMCENLILNQLDVTDVENDLLDPDIDIDDYFD